MRLRTALVLFICSLVFLFFGNSLYAAGPAIVSLLPASGSSLPNTAKTFTSTYSDSDGWETIQNVQLLISVSSLTRANSVYAYYSQNTNKLYLRDDTNRNWLGGFSPGSANTIENSYCRLDCARVSISGITNDLNINWAISFKQGFLGQKNIYSYTKDDVNSRSAWVQNGVWEALSEGVVIEAVGAEVILADTKVSAVIPEGAVSTPTAINITSLKTGLQNTPLSNTNLLSTSLLSVIECLPQELKFNKQIQIIYRLPQAEITGTTVELGLYDSRQNQISASLGSSVVQPDSYTINFEIMRFAAYAVFKSLNLQNIPIDTFYFITDAGTSELVHLMITYTRQK